MIVLIGMPGCGKSTVGRMLARRLGAKFQDSDQVIEERIDCSIRSFFDTHGEAAFRDLEASTIAELLAVGGDGVLATGGGAVLRSSNREVMRAGAQVIYLKATPEELFRRLRNDTKRPLLQVQDPLGRLQSLYAERDPLYRQTAHFVIEAGRGSVTSVVNLVMMQWEQNCMHLNVSASPKKAGGQDQALQKN